MKAALRRAGAAIVAAYSLAFFVAMSPAQLDEWYLSVPLLALGLTMWREARSPATWPRSSPHPSTRCSAPSSASTVKGFSTTAASPGFPNRSRTSRSA